MDVGCQGKTKVHWIVWDSVLRFLEILEKGNFQRYGNLTLNEVTIVRRLAKGKVDDFFRCHMILKF